MMNEIWLATVMEDPDRKPKSRCKMRVGLFTSLEDADRAVRANTCDLWETCYDLAVIERYAVSGIYPQAHEEGWYRFDEENRVYASCERPQALKGWVQFGMS